MRFIAADALMNLFFCLSMCSYAPMYMHRKNPQCICSSDCCMYGPTAGYVIGLSPDNAEDLVL